MKFGWNYLSILKVNGSTVEGLQWISDYITHFVGEITYPFQNVIGSTVEVSEWISNYIPHFISL